MMAVIRSGCAIARRTPLARRNRTRKSCSDRDRLTEPIDGSLAEIVNPAHLGGTRHLSAAQFGQDQRDAFALVASQDRRFTVFAWSPREEMVHAHRVETLLL